MAILSEQISEFSIRHYSDQGFKIKQIETDILYDDAVDVIPCQFTYEETNIPISEEELESEEILQIILGEISY